MPLRLVVGLGNPGKAYEMTRHNAGFLVVDELARRSAASWKSGPGFRGEMAKTVGGWLLKPKTFMNESGQAIQALASYYKILPEEILLVTDDFALPFGQLRIRKNGSSGGHNGLESAFTHLGTREIPRLRIGIGSPNGLTGDYVLDKFTSEELPALDQTVVRAADCVESVLTQGLEKAMNQFNQNLKPES